MFCPFCRSVRLKVNDTRTNEETGIIRRRRQCLDCKGRFTTLEALEVLPLPMVVKNNGVRVEFSREKLERSIQLALKKRPVSTEMVDKMLHRIIQKAMETRAREIPSKAIGDWVIEELRAIDPVAYVRYASVYWDFKTLDNFTETILRF